MATAKSPSESGTDSRLENEITLTLTVDEIYDIRSALFNDAERHSDEDRPYLARRARQLRKKLEPYV